MKGALKKRQPERGCSLIGVGWGVGGSFKRVPFCRTGYLRLFQPAFQPPLGVLQGADFGLHLFHQRLGLAELLNATLEHTHTHTQMHFHFDDDDHDNKMDLQSTQSSS